MKRLVGLGLLALTLVTGGIGAGRWAGAQDTPQAKAASVAIAVPDIVLTPEGEETVTPSLYYVRAHIESETDIKTARIFGNNRTGSMTVSPGVKSGEIRLLAVTPNTPPGDYKITCEVKNAQGALGTQDVTLHVVKP